jgi:hypothetical protein
MAQVLGEEAAKEAAVYMWRRPDGTPYLPWVIYHAADKGQMWDEREWHELVHGTYLIALLWTFWTHALKEASWEQKYMVDLMLQGLQTKGKDAAVRQRVTVDPGSILAFKSQRDSEGRPTGGTVSSIGAAVDPKAMAEAILLYQQVVATHLGVSPADIQTTSAGEQSGIAISLTRAGLRKMQRRYMPQFKAGDEELLQKVAWTHNLFGDPLLPKLPPDGYTVSYPALPLAPDEMAAILDRHAKLAEFGIESAVDLMMALDSGLTRDAAMERLRMVARENAKIEAMKQAPTGTPTLAEAGATLLDSLTKAGASADLVAQVAAILGGTAPEAPAEPMAAAGGA